jgi:hypothetical protein
MGTYQPHHTTIETGGDPTRRAVLSGIGGLSLAALFAARGAPAAAQHATPGAPLTGLVGLTAQLMGNGQPASAPGLELTLRRLTIAPGGGMAAHRHPGSLVFFIEAGTSGYTVLGGTAHVTRPATDGTPIPAEEVPVGTEAILNPGDWVFADGDAGGDPSSDPSDIARNVGDDDLVILIAGLTRVGEPFLIMLDAPQDSTPGA